MDSYIIKKEIQAFETSVKNLSNDIKHVSSLWSDAKYKELFVSVSDIAKGSRDLILAGDRCCAAIDRFEAIASEEY